MIPWVKEAPATHLPSFAELKFPFPSPKPLLRDIRRFKADRGNLLRRDTATDHSLKMASLKERFKFFGASNSPQKTVETSLKALTDLKQGRPPHSLRSQRARCESVKTLVETDHVCAAEQGGVGVLLDMLWRYQSERDPSICEICAQALSLFGPQVTLQTGPICLAELLGSRGIALVLSVARDHESNSKIQGATCTLLSHVVASDYGAQLVAWWGVSTVDDCLVGNVVRWPNDREMVHHAVATLSLLCTSQTTVRVRLARNAALPAFLKVRGGGGRVAG